MGAEALLPPLSTLSAKEEEKNEEAEKEEGELKEVERGRGEGETPTLQTLACRFKCKAMPRLWRW